MIRIGEISYANCVPIFAALRETGMAGRYRFIQGEPAELNRRLFAGEIDFAPCSSFEYGLHAADYLLVPDFSISAEREVKSVLLFSRVPVEQLEAKTILLSPASASSNALIRILMRNHFHSACLFKREDDWEPDKADARIVIGNPALKARLAGEQVGYVYDLASLWNQYTGLPFVFALWILRRDAALSDPKGVASLISDLSYAREYAMAHLDQMAKEYAPSLGISEQDLVRYWQSISYDLNDDKVRSLERYFDEAADLGLLSRSPSLEFFRAS